MQPQTRLNARHHRRGYGRVPIASRTALSARIQSSTDRFRYGRLPNRFSDDIIGADTVEYRSVLGRRFRRGYSRVPIASDTAAYRSLLGRHRRRQERHTRDQLGVKYIRSLVAGDASGPRIRVLVKSEETIRTSLSQRGAKVSSDLKGHQNAEKSVSESRK